MFEDAFIAPYASELLAFGNHWCGPETYKLWEETLVARYESEGDGQSVEVYCCAAPARFYTIKVLADTNSVGDPLKPWELGTGSSMADLAAKIAKAASRGMLGFHELEGN